MKLPRLLPPRPFISAFMVALLGSIVAGALAILPTWGGKYDPSLAVLTATLIVVIWYTYFTFRMVHHQPLAYLRARVRFAPPQSGVVITPIVRNPMARPMRVKVSMEVWIDGQPVDVGPFYRAGVEQTLNPLGYIRGWVDLGPGLKYRTAEDGTNVVASNEVLVRFQCFWDDGLGDRGETASLYHRWDIPSGKRYSPVEPEVAQRFGKLVVLS